MKKKLQKSEDEKSDNIIQNINNKLLINDLNPDDSTQKVKNKKQNLNEFSDNKIQKDNNK